MTFYQIFFWGYVFFAVVNTVVNFVALKTNPNKIKKRFQNKYIFYIFGFLSSFGYTFLLVQQTIDLFRGDFYEN